MEVKVTNVEVLETENVEPTEGVEEIKVSEIDTDENPVVSNTTNIEVEETKEEKKKVTVEEIIEDSQKHAEEEEVEKSKGFLRNFMNYIKSKAFNSKCDDLSRKYNVPSKVVAKSFLTKALGTISDVLHIAIGAVEDCAITIINILTSDLKSGAKLICNVARALTSIVTLNRTCKA